MQVDEEGEQLTAVICVSHGVTASRREGLLHEADLAVGSDTRGSQVAWLDAELPQASHEGAHLQRL